MIIKKVHELNIVSGEYDICKLDFIDKVLSNNVTNLIYFVKNQILYGYISLNMILSSNVATDEIHVNRRLSFIKSNDSNWYKNLKKYRSSSGEGEVPIVDDEQNLKGAYCFDDEEIDFCRRNTNILDSINNYFDDKQFVLVFPRKNISYNIFKLFKYKFQENNIHFSLDDLDSRNVLDIGKESILLFVDTSEKEIMDYLKRHDDTYNQITRMTYKELVDILLNSYKRDTFVESLEGVKIYTFNFDITQNIKKSDYIKDYRNMMKYRKTICVGKEFVIPSELKNKFLDDLYCDEYWEQFKGKRYPQYKKDGITYLKDFSSEYINIKDGERITLYQNQDFNNIIYFVGRCTFVGSRVEDKNTIPSLVQKMIADKGLKYNVINKSSWDDVNGRIWKILNIKMKKGDIIVIHDIGILKNCINIHAAEIACNEKMPLDWFTDRFEHANHHALGIWAKSIFDVINNDISESHELVDRDALPDIDARKIYIKRFYIDRYFKNIDLTSFKTIGSIVMNCNPFTKGHRYLIEQAKSYVDFLIIFVVEEDKSFFAFEDRIKMVENGVQDINNVFVVPSGDFILSSSTFPEYFIKIMDSDIVNNVEFDITLFAECIASNLKITHRFVGQELSDEVTNEYNKAMHKILPGYGIQVIEIPRIRFSNKPISASLVRGYLEANVYEELHDILPVTTIDYLNVNISDKNIGDSIRIIDSYKDGCNWYRIYSDGFCEQGGRVINNDEIIAGKNWDFEVELHKIYRDCTYSVMLTVTYPDFKNKRASSGEELNTYQKSKNSFHVFYHSRNGKAKVPAGCGVEWRATGFLF